MSGYISVPRQAGGHLKNGVLDILVQWSGGHIGGGIAYERIVALAARSTAPPIEPQEPTVADVVDEYLTAKDAEIARLRAGFMKCLQDQNECDAWLYGSACRTAEKCRCAMERELWCNRAVPKEDT